VPTADVERAYAALRGKQARCAKLWRYYDGDHPLVYANTKLRHVFEHIDARWFENWTAVVVDSLLDRVQLTGFASEDEPAQQLLADLWDAQDGDAEAEAVAKAVAVTGEGFLIVERVDDDGLRFIENPPHLCHVQYSEDDPKTPQWAAKWWEEEESRPGGQLAYTTFLTLYYPDRQYHFSAHGRRGEIGAANFQPADPPETPADVPGILPVFHFRRSRRPGGELDSIVPLQDALNKLLADMMVAAEYGAFSQRYIIANADVSNLKNGPNAVWNIPAGETEGQAHSVGQFDVTPLDNFITGLDHLASRIAIITRTPKHYLLQAGADVSGEALLAMEAPLVRKAAKYRARLDVTWKQCAAYLCGLLGHQLNADDIECLWEDEHTVQPYTEALIIKTLTEAGMPLTTVLRREGWDEEDLDALAEDRDADAARQTQLSTQLMASASQRFDQGQVGYQRPDTSPEAPKPSKPDLTPEPPKPR
jgi:hypothetical protein